MGKEGQQRLQGWNDVVAEQHTHTHTHTHTLTKRANMHGTKAQRWSGNESRQAMSVR